MVFRDHTHNNNNNQKFIKLFRMDSERFRRISGSTHSCNSIRLGYVCGRAHFRVVYPQLTHCIQRIMHSHTCMQHADANNVMCNATMLHIYIIYIQLGVLVRISVPVPCDSGASRVVVSRAIVLVLSSYHAICALAELACMSHRCSHAVRYCLLCCACANTNTLSCNQYRTD